MKIFRKKAGHPIVRIILLLLIVGAAAFFFFKDIKKASAEWFDSSWYYRNAVNISNAGTAQTDYQISITLDTATLITASKMQSDCDDIRVTDANGKLLPYWIETGTNACNTATTAIWTKVPSVPTSGQTVYVYYGNPNATSYQNGNNTFQFFDDFSGSSLDASKWTATGAYSVSGGAITVTTGAVYTKNTVSSGAQNYIYEYRSKWNTTSGSYAGLQIANAQGTSGGNSTSKALVYFMSPSSASLGIIGYAANGSAASYNLTSGSAQYTASQSTYVINGFSVDSTDIRFYNNRTQTNPYTGTWTAAPYLWLGYYAGSNSGTTDIKDITTDWVLVRKYSVTPPTIGSTGSEEKGPAPVASWKFDEGQGQTAYDDSTNNNDGTLGATSGSESSDPTWQTGDMCVSGKCLKFDGSTSYVLAGTGASLNMGTNDIAIGMWVKRLAYGAQQRLYMKRQASAIWYDLFFHSDDTIHASIAANYPTIGNSTISSTRKITDANWHYVVVVFNRSSNGQIYIDGIADGPPVDISANSGSVSNTGTAYVGAYVDASAQYFNGFIDDVKIYPYARTAAQIKADFNSRGTTQGSSAQIGVGNQLSSALSNGLVGYWKMDDASIDAEGETSTDSSGAGNTGTLYGDNGVGDNGTGLDCTATGKFGTGCDLDGTDDYIDAGSGNSLILSSGGTISSWFKMDSWNGTSWSNTIIGKGTSSWANHHYILFKENGTNNMLFSVSDGTNYLGTNGPRTATLQLSTWYYITATWDSTKKCVYLNGVLSQCVNSTIMPINSAAAVSIGKTGTNGYYLDGLIDELRVYNRALSPKEIADLYNFAPGPVGWWKMDEASWNGTAGEVKDSSGNGLSGVRAGNSNVISSGKYGKAGKFDGDSDYVEIDTGSNMKSSVVTTSAWVYSYDVTRSYGRIVIRDQASADEEPWDLDFSGSTGNPRFRVEDSGGIACTAASTSPLNNNQWYYVTGVFDGTYTKLYINGILVNQSSACGFTSLSLDDSNISIGGDWSNPTSYEFYGLIDDVKIYNYARTQKQIAEDMNAGHPSIGSPVGSYAAWWKFDEGHDNATYDQSVNANTGTNNGAVWTNDGKLGKALNFDGAASYVDMGTGTSLNITDSITLSAWVKTKASGITQAILGRNLVGSGDHTWELAVTTGNQLNLCWASGYSCSAAATMTGSKTVNDGKWHHVVATVDASNMRIYVDGVVDVTKSRTTTPTSNTSLKVQVGAFFGYSHYFLGSIDEVKIYPFALTQADIQAEYNQRATLAMGSLSDTSGLTGGSVASNSASAVYCIPGDTTSCASPIGEWKFDEYVSGNSQALYDTSGRGNNGTTNWGANASGMDCKAVGKSVSACKFDDVDDYVDLGTNTILNPANAIAVEVWFYPSSVTGVNAIIGRNSLNYSYGIYTNGTTLYWQVGNSAGSSAIVSGGTISLNNWYHAVGIYDGTNIRLYLNGSEIGTPTAVNSLYQHSESTYVGKFRDSGSTYPFSGIIDDVKIFNYARTPAQIAWDYNRGKPVGHWKFDECQGTTAYDQSDNNNDGTITIGATIPQSTAGTCTTPTDGTGAWYNGATGKFNSSMSFDGVDDSIAVNDLDVAGAIAISAWIKTGSSDVQVIARKANTYQLAITTSASCAGSVTGSVAMIIGTGSSWSCTTAAGWLNGTTSLADNNWHYVIGTFDDASNTMKIYVDGVLQATNTSATVSFGTNNNTLYLGRDVTNLTFPFSGLIDDVKIFNYALTLAQIKMDYNQGSAIRFGPTSGRP